MGRTLGEQVRDEILREYRISERKHVLEEEYVSDVTHQDGYIPYRMQITYEDGGASYHVNDYFPHFHYQTGAVLADYDYDELINWSSEEQTQLEDLELDSEPIETLVEKGSVGNISELDLD